MLQEPTMSRKANLTLHFVLGLGLVAAAPLGRAQDQPPQRERGTGGQFAGMNRVSGEITAIAPGKITIKTEDGATIQVVTTDNTRMMKGRGETLKFADIKVGDGVTAMGNLDGPNQTLHAAMLGVMDAAQVKALKDNLGKTYIAGKVTAIDLDNATMTVLRADHVSQTIGFDETTSFNRGRVAMGGRGAGFGGGEGGGGGYGGRGGAGQPPNDGSESITLADIKVGDNVGGTGSLKNGVFVPTQLNVAAPGNGQGRRRGGEGTPMVPPAAAAPPPQR
jgi:hypothetical protein